MRCLACVAALVTYRVKDPERRTLDDEARTAAPGQFVRLADGVTHYETTGPDTGRVVVLAAAFSVPAYLSDSLFQRLGRAGFRAVRFDYYGRGWSDRLDTTYGLDLFVRQMAGLLDSLGVLGPVDVVGLSFGAAIVTDFADRHPDRVRSLIYIDPVFNTGRPLPPRERTAFAWDWYMVFRGGTDAMAEGQPDDFLHPERHPDWVERYRVQQQFKGTREAWRRTRVAIAVAPHQEEQLRRVGRLTAPGARRLGSSGHRGGHYGERRAPRRDAARHPRAGGLGGTPAAPRAAGCRGAGGGGVSHCRAVVDRGGGQVKVRVMSNRMNRYPSTSAPTATAATPDWMTRTRPRAP